jgi:tetratricopeptide (TPR) repeat protein
MSQKQTDIQSAALIREALQSVADSESFQNVERLKQILRYVVERHLAGEGPNIRAKSIALDVYSYLPDEVPDHENAIRVDIGRLRQRLAAYYLDEGKNDLVVISLPKGTYAPEFQFLQPTAPETSAQDLTNARSVSSTRNVAAPKRPPTASARTSLLLVFGFVLAVTAGAVVAVKVASLQEIQDAVPPENALRAAIFEASPARLEAMNLASAGRKLIFPAADPKRLQAALFVFEVSRETDKTFFGGYAGAAQVLALSALVSPIEQHSREALIASKSMVEASEDLAPDAAWTHSARASYEWAVGNFDDALTKSSTARRLDPKDAHLLEFDALISLFAGRFDRVVESVEAYLGQVELPKSSVFNNALGSAYFHAGNSEKCISVFEDAIAAGAPTGPITVAYLAAAHQQLGNQEQASKRVRQIIETWPKYRLDLLFEKLFQNPADSDFLLNNLRKAGWRPNGKPS